MIDLAPAELPADRRPARRTWIVRLAIVAVLVAGAITAGATSLHYLHAPGLETDGGGWLPPDNATARFVTAGTYTSIVARPRPGHPQTFELDVYNPSSVAQTVLGLTDGATLGDARMNAEPVHLTVSTTPSFPARAELTYTSRPVVIPPHRSFTLRVTRDTAHIWGSCRSESWASLSLQVRVGVFTRTEKLDFGSMIIELREPGPGC